MASSPATTSAASPRTRCATASTTARTTPPQTRPSRCAPTGTSPAPAVSCRARPPPSAWSPTGSVTATTTAATIQMRTNSTADPGLALQTPSGEAIIKGIPFKGIQHYNQCFSTVLQIIKRHLSPPLVIQILKGVIFFSPDNTRIALFGVDNF